jgi:hypothetical protein
VKRLFLLIILMLCATISLAQGQNTNSAVNGNSKTAVSKDGKTIELQSGAQLVAQLQNTLDVGKAKEGDEVIFKTTQAIQSNGEVVVKKGATLIGHITEVQKKSKEHNQSSLNMVFDRLETGALSMPISATITSITPATSIVNVDDTMFSTSQSAGSRSTASTRSQGSGGLLGGVTNTVGSVVNTTTQTVGGATQPLGGVVDSTTGTLGKTTGSAGNTLTGLQILQSTSANAEGGSTLALTGGNLRLEKGTSFNLLLNNESKAETKAVKKAAKRGIDDNQ